MMHKSTPAALSTSILPPMSAGLFAIVVFIVDTITPLDIAVTVLSVVIVLIAANHFNRGRPCVRRIQRHAEGAGATFSFTLPASQATAVVKMPVEAPVP